MGTVSIPDNHTSRLRCQSTPAAGPCGAEQYLEILGSLAAPRFSSGQLESAPVNPAHQILKQIEQLLSFKFSNASDQPYKLPSKLQGCLHTLGEGSI